VLVHERRFNPLGSKNSIDQSVGIIGSLAE
jgi:hypothetical protein